MLEGLLIVVLVLVAAGLATRFYMDRAVENALKPGEDVAIRELRDPLSGNAFLACPPDYCAATAIPSPVFALPRDWLAAAMRRVFAGEPNLYIIDDAPEAHRITVIQHTPLLRFPDIVTVECVALGPERSAVAIYSRSRYGKGDFGTNRRRVLSWLARLEREAAQ